MKYKKTIILIILLALGILAQQLGWFDWQWLYEQGKQYAHMWWFPLAIIAAMVVLFAFAQAGSMLFWVAGLFYGTITATIIIVAGGVGGALAAYKKTSLFKVFSFYSQAHRSGDAVRRSDYSQFPTFRN
jgi:uncharacterized membrane protein YdjX (TVP38/TMEM64 family)